jgi:hypothetical protein
VTPAEAMNEMVERAEASREARTIAGIAGVHVRVERIRRAALFRLQMIEDRS